MELTKKKYKNPYEEIADEEEIDENEPVNIDNNSDIKLNIKKLDGTSFDIKLDKSSTISNLKFKICEEHNVQIPRQRLIYKAQELKNDSSLLSEFGIEDDSILHMVIRPLDSIPQPNNDNNNSNNNNNHVGINIAPEGGYNPNNNVDNNNNPNNVDNNGANVVIDPELYRVYRLCRFIKIFALIDAIFLLLEGASYPNFYFLIIFAICGYWGAKRLNRICLILYVICLLLEIIFTISIMTNGNPLGIVLMVIMIFIRIFVSKTVIELYKTIPRLTDEQKQLLMARNRRGVF